MSEVTVDLRRTIAAPRHEVYRAFLDPALLHQWMCPRTCAVSHAEVDERVGGRHRVEFLFPDGERHAFESVIRGLVPGERIDLDFTFEGPAVPLRRATRMTLTFADAGDGATELRLVQSGLTGEPPFTETSVSNGWGGALAKLQALYEKETTR